MTEYWKSNARKYCDFCKCWIADNKISVSYHEGGKKHKENVAKKISELSKKSVKEHRSQKREDAEMRKMEKAALAAYMKDIQSNEGDITSQGIKKTLEETDSYLTLKTSTEPTNTSETSETQSEKDVEWHEVVSEDGSKYYWNTQNNETTWDKPEKFLTIEQQEKKKKKEFRKKKLQDDQLNKTKHDEELKEQEASQRRELMKSIKVKSDEEAPPKFFGPMAKPENPLGSWVPVIKKLPEKIDLQLPERNITTVTAPVVKEEKEKVFKEKQITSLSDSFESTEFKKRKFAGSSQKHSRRRLDDD